MRGAVCRLNTPLQAALLWLRCFQGLILSRPWGVELINVPISVECGRMSGSLCVPRVQGCLCQHLRREQAGIQASWFPGIPPLAMLSAGTGEVSLYLHIEMVAGRLLIYRERWCNRGETQPVLPDSKQKHSWECFLERMGMLLVGKLESALHS